MAEETKSKPRLTWPGLLVPFLAITTLYFIFGFVTNLTSQGLVPELQKVFAIESIPIWQATLASSAFFLAYFVFATPTAWLIEKIGYKSTMMTSLFVQVVGALLFLPAAQMVSFPLFLVAIFVIGAGVTGLQTAVNPYAALLGPEETSAVRLNLAQAVNSVGATLAPYVVGAVILTGVARDPATLTNASAAERHLYQMGIAGTVRLPYIVVAIVLVLLGIALGFARLPHPTHKQNGDAEPPAKHSIWSYRHTVLGALGIFLYVGVEVGLAVVMVGYFSNAMHNGLNVLTVQAAQKLVTFYWMGALVGRLLAPAMLAKAKAGKLLGLFGLAAAILVVLSIFVPGYAAVGALILCGFFNSVMFPTIFALGVAGLGPMTSRGSGIISMAIIGGAIVPVLINWVVGQCNYQVALILPVICYLYIAWYGASGSKPAKAVA
jgi:FHS family L-fucose permease-like MFS transporter